MGKRIGSSLIDTKKYIVSYFVQGRLGAYGGHSFITIAVKTPTKYRILGAYGIAIAFKKSFNGAFKIISEKIDLIKDRALYQEIIVYRSGFHYPVCPKSASRLMFFLEHTYLRMNKDETVKDRPKNFSYLGKNCHGFAVFCLSLCGIFDARISDNKRLPVDNNIKTKLEFNSISKKEEFQKDNYYKNLLNAEDLSAINSFKYPDKYQYGGIDKDRCKRIIAHRRRAGYEDEYMEWDEYMHDCLHSTRGGGFWSMDLSISIEKNISIMFPESYLGIAKRVVRKNNYKELDDNIILKIAEAIFADYYGKSIIHWGRHHTGFARDIVNRIRQKTILTIEELNDYIYFYMCAEAWEYYRSGRSFYKRLAFVNMIKTKDQLKNIGPNMYIANEGRKRVLASDRILSKPQRRPNSCLASDRILSKPQRRPNSCLEKERF
ncbi:MAG: hypothetical protein GY730_01690 [bacterium]|nr:hypothetical protein [bacterium]